MGWVTLNLRKMDDQVLHNNFQAQLLEISRRRQQVARNKGLQSLLINNERKTMLSDAKVDKENKYKEYQEAYDKYTKLKKAYDKAKSNSQTYKNKANDKYSKVITDENFNPVLKDGKPQELESAYKDKDGNYYKENNSEGTYEAAQTGYWLGDNYKVVDDKNILTDVNYYKDGDNDPALVLSESQLEALKAQVDAAEGEKTLIYTEYNEEVTRYEENKKNLNDDFDMQQQTLEEETTTEENSIDLEQTQIETQLESFTQELQAVKQQVSQDMQNVVIKLG